MLRAYGITDPALVETAQARYIEDRYRGLQLYAESLEVIQTVARTCQIGMITNGPAEIQREKLRLLKLLEIFPSAIISGEVGVWKPERAIFEMALRQTGVAANDAAYVGDSPAHDVPGAQAAGMRAIWINRAGRAWPGGDPPDIEIRTLRELLPALGLERLA